MAIFHFHAQILGRGPGRRTQTGAMKKRRDNVVAAAAYRAGQRLTDHSGERPRTEDYQHRKGVMHREIMAPEGSATWLKDREQLWNAVERMEKRKDAQLAREIDAALPHELTNDQRIEMVRSFVAGQFVSRGMVADFALHSPVEAKGDDRRNHHVHIMLTLRQGTPEGLRSVKTREWNARENIELWRQAWADHTNRTLERYGHAGRVDHRTLTEQAREASAIGDRRTAAALDRVPEVHVGPRPRAMQQRQVKPKSRVREAGAPRTAQTRAHQKAAREQARREAWQEALERRRAVGEEEYQEWLEKQREDREKDWGKRQEQRRLDRLIAMQETGRKVTTRTLTPAEAARERGKRQQQALAKLTAAPTSRRVRNYPQQDKGPRIGLLWDILTGNNEKAKRDIARIDAASARFTRWLDYWDRKVTWMVEGKIGGAAYRRQRWMDSKAERENGSRDEAKIAHAQKRAAQMKGLTDELRGIAAVLMGRQEDTLVRRRQIEGWARPVERQQERTLTRGRERR